jgi:hypothetical protein
MRLVPTASLHVLCAAPLAAQFSPPACVGMPYSDVPELDSFCPWIQQLKVDEITEGCGGGNYCPHNPVTRQQLAMMLERAVRGTATFKVDAGTLDGFDSSQFQKKYAKVANVALSGGDYTDPVAAVAALATWCGTPADANRCLVKVWPGTYLLSQALVLPGYVDLAGAGVEMTRLSRTGGVVPDTPAVQAQGIGEVHDIEIFSSFSSHALGLLLADGSQRRLRNARVWGLYGSVSSVAVRVSNGSNPRIENSRLEVVGPSPFAKGLDVGGLGASSVNVWSTLISVSNVNGTGECAGIDSAVSNYVFLEDVQFGVQYCSTGIGLRTAGNGIASGGYINAGGSTVKNVSIQILAGSPTFLIREVRALAFSPGGVALVVQSGENVEVRHSYLLGSDHSLEASAGSAVVFTNSVLTGGNPTTADAGDQIFIGNSQMDGAPIGPGTYKCAASHDGAFDPVLANCT